MSRNITTDHVPGAVVLRVPGAQHGMDPKDAAELGKELIEEAQNAIHAERVGRRNTG
ncbi:hypothetical protein EDF51_106133 [Curtobacterium sp. PhB25]|uniref:hypothetical protein n=1 Tax=Curtobacterium sp. PhB25 TaxID=2485205 RepID=UPI0010ED7451|nr:hypothetical protein [Curtobacterium sp. PhB25]TDW69149.1 hypothetical protein EDF51_106133 [Curtobacterium sp. PhB25]